MKKYIFILTAFTLLAAGCTPSAKQDSETPSVPQKGSVPALVDPSGHFTILSWTGVKNSYAEYGFQKLVEAGFNTYLGWYDNISEAEVALTKADAAGIKMIISCPELHTDTKNITKAFSAHPSFLAYHIEDEPEVSEFEGLGGQIRNIKQYDTEHPTYVNFYPNWCWGEDIYLNRIRQYAKTVPMDFVSFDNYPCRSVDGVTVVRKDWYHNLEDIRTLAKENNVPFWGFALSLAHKTPECTYPIPTIGELRLQQFSNLVYGATGFQYFTTWGHIQDNHITGVYQTIQTVNSELIGMEPIFVGADIKYIWHIGSEIPSGCKALTKAPSGIKHITTDDGNAVVSYFVNNDKKYVAIVNKNPNGGMNLDIDFTDPSKAYRYDKNSASAQFQPGVIRLAAGDIAIFSWQ